MLIFRQWKPQETSRQSSRRGMQYSRQVEREIRKEQARMLQEECAIPKVAFTRLVREVMQSSVGGGEDFKFSPQALSVLHVVSETMAVEILTLWNKAAKHAKRVTVLEKDVAHISALMQLVQPGILATLRERANKQLCRPPKPNVESQRLDWTKAVDAD